MQPAQPTSTLPSNVESLVLVIDDDAAVRASLKSLLRSIGLHVETFGSAAELLASKLPNIPSCLVLDVRLDLPVHIRVGNGEAVAVDKAVEQLVLGVFLRLLLALSRLTRRGGAAPLRGNRRLASRDI